MKMNSIKNNPSLNAHQDWVAYLEEAAEILIDENRVMDGAKYLKECHRWVVKRGDNIGLTDGGAYEFMVHLMEHCTKNQIKQVHYLLMEFFPRMHKKWFFRNTLMKHYYQTLQREF